VAESLGDVSVTEVGEGRAGLADVLGGIAPPLRRLEGDASGRPRYDAAGLKAAPGWGARAAGPTLVIGDAQLDRREWSALESFAVGSCEPVLQALAEGQEESLALLEPFLDRFDAILWRSFRAGLAKALPEFTAELAPYAEVQSRANFADRRELDTYLCGQASSSYVESFRRCEESPASCRGAPRIFLVGGAKIGFPEPDIELSDACPQLLGRDYVGEIRELALTASRDAARAANPEWSVLAERLGLIAEVHAALEDICLPRRRRFSDEALAEGRRRVQALGAVLGSADHQVRAANWSLEEGSLEIVGMGPVRLLARFENTGLNEEILAQARGLREWAVGASRCRHPSGELPLAVATVEATGDVSFLGYFYEEELLCGDLPPLTGLGGAAEECDMLGLDEGEPQAVKRTVRSSRP